MSATREQVWEVGSLVVLSEVSGVCGSALVSENDFSNGDRQEAAEGLRRARELLLQARSLGLGLGLGLGLAPPQQLSFVGLGMMAAVALLRVAVASALLFGAIVAQVKSAAATC